MIYSGPQTIDIPAHSTIRIMCTRKFTCLGLDANGLLTSIIGPPTEGDRLLDRKLPPDITSLKIETGKHSKWEVTITDNRGVEDLDHTPVDMGVKEHRALDQYEGMRDFIRTEISRQAEENEDETFEEADDFDIPSENDDILSQYELRDMEEEEIHRPVGDPENENDLEKPPEEVELPLEPEKQPVVAPERPPKLPPT